MLDTLKEAGPLGIALGILVVGGIGYFIYKKKFEKKGK